MVMVRGADLVECVKIAFHTCGPRDYEKPKGVFRMVSVMLATKALADVVRDWPSWAAVHLCESKKADDGTLEYSVVTASMCRVSAGQEKLKSAGDLLVDVMDYTDGDWDHASVRQVRLLEWPRKMYRRHAENVDKAAAAIA